MDHPGERIIEQRLRNRAMEALEVLSAGDDGVREVGVGSYVEEFFDVIDDAPPSRWREWSCWTAEEVRALAHVHQLLDEACAATPGVESEDGFIDSGWPTTIQPAARNALALMRARGRFREDVEEDRPSSPA